MCAMRRESDADRAVAAVLRQQGGLITRTQVLAAGWSVAALRHRIRPGGPWLAVLPGIYLGSNGPLADGQREIAAVLYAGAGCVLTGPAALRHQGVRVPATNSVDVLVPVQAKKQSVDFVRMHRTRRMPDQTFVLNGIRSALAARAERMPLRTKVWSGILLVRCIRTKSTLCFFACTGTRTSTVFVAGTR